MRKALSPSQHRRGLILILFLGVLICLWQLGSTGLIDETPPLFAAASRAMSETGNWITPRVNGLPRFDKPPLVYWLMGFFYSLPGHNFFDPLGSWAARLPSAISTVLLMLVVGDTLMKWPGENILYPRKTAVIAALAFVLSPLVIIWSRIAVSDALLCSTLGISLILTWRTYVNPIHKYWWASWFVLGLAVLSKGPVALVLMAMTLSFFALIQKEYLYLFRRIKAFKGILITLLISIPWYIVELLIEGKPFWDSFFGYHNFQRLTSVVNSHSQPWWFFLIMLIIGSLPFTPFLIVSLFNFFNYSFKANSPYSTNKINSLINFVGSWIISVFLLFTLAATKLPSYWLPATPAAAIMIALSSSSIYQRYRSQSILYLLTALSMLILAISLSLPSLWIFSINDPEMPTFAVDLLGSNLHIKAAILFLIASFIALYLVFQQKYKSIIYIQIPLIFFQVFVMLPMWKLGDKLRQLPLRELAKEVLLLNNLDEPIAMVGIRKPSLHFYTNKIITFESNDGVALVNLSERLRREIRQKWNNNKPHFSSKSNTVLLVIDKQTSTYSHWKDLNPERLGGYGIYRIWRIERSVLEEREFALKKNGVISDWNETKKERY
ncbi:ArnT family glycosyltransferase [Prochlorococcus marinus]|uniref:ArnT family glycosyltransferase n=1 Tax=Prochlorococcus marinus TaxID=1219 RepID=UPI0022B44AF8|nr:glycosyltransferase family 39 protein [Prochlorococcus marinus]